MKLLAACRDAGSFTPFSDLFPASRYDLLGVAENSLQLRRMIQTEQPALTVILSPLTDGPAIRLAAEVSSAFQVQVLLFVHKDLYDQAVYQCRDADVFVMSLPVYKNLGRQTITMLEKVRRRIALLESDLKKSRIKEREGQTIFRCKLLLMERMHWQEDQAHHYIEKQAMDHSMTKGNAAKLLLDKLEREQHA